MQPFPGTTESLADRNLRLSYYAEENGRLWARSESHPWRNAVGRGLIKLGAKLAPEIRTTEARISHG